MATKSIVGNKGGSSGGHTPVESPDSIQSIAKAKVLIALGEGEFQWGIDGQSVYLDGTPVLGPGGGANFSGVAYDCRTGTQSQSYIKGLPSVENETTISTELRSGSPWTRSISNNQLSAIRIRLGWPSLQEQKTNGDVGGYRIEYVIELSTNGGSFQAVINGVIDDKTTSLYERSHRINLPSATSGWTVRARRITPNADSSRIADTMNIEAISEIIDAKLRYPNTALLYIEFDAKQFPNRIPQISCKPKGRVIRVPDNYNPDTRAYTGTWLGGFKWAWSNNPAWVFYDIVLSEMFGLGSRIDSTQIDKWELYRIAQYCDQMVPDGRGGSGTEPRHMCDVYIQSREDAWTVLTDIASIFRASTYWWQGQMYAFADMPRDLGLVFNQANIIGKFSRQSGSERDVNTIAMVAWSDPSNHYADATETVFVSDLVNRFGANQIDVTAIGCTRPSEAHRKGLWTLYTNSDDNLHAFNVGLEGQIPLPGHIIGVANNYFAGRTIGGRVSAVSGRNIMLDRIPSAKVSDRLILNLPSGESQARTIQAVNGKTITVTTAFSETPVVECAWAIDADDLFIQQCRVVSIKDNNDNTFAISAIVHDPDKYERIDTGARIEDRPISVIPPSVQSPPSGVAIASFTQINQGLAITSMRASWKAVENAIAYEAEWRRDSSNWIATARTSAQGFDVPNIYAGRYLVRVRAVNASDVSSQWAYSTETYLKGKEGAPPKPVGFRADPAVFGIVLSWGFPDGAEDTLKTEIHYSLTADGGNEMLLADVPYPSRMMQQMGLRAGQEFWYKARLVDKTGNEGEWTDWIHGQSSTDVDDILGDIVDKVLETDAGKQLTANVNTNIDAMLQNALNLNASVDHQMAASGKNRADILTVRQTVADNDKAYAQQFQQVQASIGSNTAAIQQTSTALADTTGKLSAQYSVKVAVDINGRQYAAGMGIGVENTPAGMQTQVLFLADRFSILSATGQNFYSPFTVQNGQVFISDAFIQNGTITSAKIADASITSAKIGSSIQSSNYSASNGWRIGVDDNTMTFRSSSSGAFMDASGFGVKNSSGLTMIKLGAKP